MGPISVAAARRPRSRSRSRCSLAGRHLAGVDDADLRHVERAGDAAHHGRKRPDRQLVPERVVAGEHHADSASRIACSTRPNLLHDAIARQQVEADQHEAGQHEEEHAHAGRRDRHAEDALEVGEAVVAAEARLVAEEQQHRGEGQRLRDDREIHALDARAEREEAEHEGSRPGTRTTSSIVATKLSLPKVQCHGSAFQSRNTMKSGRSSCRRPSADLAHQVHAHRIAAQREEQAVAERQDAGVAPDQVHRQRTDRVAHDLAEQRHRVVGQVEGLPAGTPG